MSLHSFLGVFTSHDLASAESKAGVGDSAGVTTVGDNDEEASLGDSKAVAGAVSKETCGVVEAGMGEAGMGEAGMGEKEGKAEPGDKGGEAGLGEEGEAAVTEQLDDCLSFFTMTEILTWLGLSVGWAGEGTLAVVRPDNKVTFVFNKSGLVGLCNSLILE